MLTLEARVQADPDLLSTEIDGETVMMDVVSGNYYSLDSIGSRIWRALAQPVAITDLCATLEREYDAPEDVIRKDVLALLDDMLARRLIRVEA